MKKRTKKQIDEQIKWLKSNKPKIRQFSAFGDDNRAAVQACIDALVEDMDTDTIDEKFDNGDWSDGERSSAQSAINWRDGDEDDSPEKNWSGLVAK